MELANILEPIMLICFGLSWPISIYRTYKVKNPLGKSIAFLWLIIIGYIAGILCKIVGNKIDWVIGLYALNAVMVAADLFLVVLYRRRNARMENSGK